MYSNDVVILCGGQGSRLRPVFSDPKILFPVGDEPFLIKLYNQFRTITSGNIILCTGYKSEKVEAFCDVNGLDVIISKEQSPAGTGGAILTALCHIKTDYFVCVNGDTLISQADMIAFFKNSTMIKAKKNIILACKASHRNERYGHVDTSPFLRIKKIDEQGSAIIDAFSGLSLIKREILKCLTFDNVSFEKLILKLRIPHDKVSKIYLKSEFYDYGTVNAARSLNEKFNIT